MKEIREENIVHEIESETNNTCHFEKEDGNPRGSPKLKSGNSETEKKRTSENDKTEKCGLLLKLFRRVLYWNLTKNVFYFSE